MEPRRHNTADYAKPPFLDRGLLIASLANPLRVPRRCSPFTQSMKPSSMSVTLTTPLMPPPSNIRYGWYPRGFPVGEIRTGWKCKSRRHLGCPHSTGLIASLVRYIPPSRSHRLLTRFRMSRRHTRHIHHIRHIRYTKPRYSRQPLLRMQFTTAALRPPLLPCSPASLHLHRAAYTLRLP